MNSLCVNLTAGTFLAPGVDGLKALKAQILAKAPAQLDPSWRAQPQCLAPRAARRLSPQIRLALAVAERLAPNLPQDAAWVFASSIGEGETLQVILESLRTPEMLVQPLRFQNAVHNAASGQWTIAAGLRGPATSIGAYDETAGAGLLKAIIQCALEQRPVGLVLYDVPLPDPLDQIHPLGIALGAGLALFPGRGPEPMAELRVSLGEGEPSRPRSAFAQAMMATGNPIARIAVLMERLLGHRGDDLGIGLHGGSLLKLAFVSNA